MLEAQGNMAALIVLDSEAIRAASTQKTEILEWWQEMRGRPLRVEFPAKDSVVEVTGLRSERANEMRDEAAGAWSSKRMSRNG